MNADKMIVIIAGPNGAGKTTLAREFLPAEAACPVFVNADLIAAGLSPFQSEAAALRAGRLMLEEITRHAAKGRSFAFETTLAGLGYVKLIKGWRKQGYRIRICFVSLDAPEDALERVAKRVRQGGHDVEEATVRRRFFAGLKNFQEIYRPLVDEWQLFSNMGNELTLLEEGEN